MSLIYYTSIFLFILLSIFLCFVILMQESKSSGLGASFGADASSSLFGTSTADVLKKFTAYLATIFMIISLILSLWTSALGRKENPRPVYSLEELE